MVKLSKNKKNREICKCLDYIPFMNIVHLIWKTTPSLDSAKYFTENLALLTALNFTVCSAIYFNLSYINYEEIVSRFENQNTQYGSCTFNGYTLVNKFNFCATTGLYSNIAAMIIETCMLLQISLSIDDLRKFEYRRRWWSWTKYFFVGMTLLYMSGFTNQVSALGWYVMMTLPNQKISEEGCSYIKGHAPRSFNYRDPWGFHNMYSILFTLIPSALFIFCWSWSILPSQRKKVTPDQTGDAFEGDGEKSEVGSMENDEDKEDDIELNRELNIMSRRPLGRM